MVDMRNLFKVLDLQVTVVDVAGFSVGTGHLNVAQSPALIGIVGRIAGSDSAYGNEAAARPCLFPGAFNTLRSATAIIQRPVIGGSEQHGLSGRVGNIAHPTFQGAAPWGRVPRVAIGV
jgi:hypothetical protein